MKQTILLWAVVLSVIYSAEVRPQADNKKHLLLKCQNIAWIGDYIFDESAVLLYNVDHAPRALGYHQSITWGYLTVGGNLFTNKKQSTTG